MAASSFFSKGLQKLMNNSIVLGSDTLKIALLKTSYTFVHTTEFLDTGGNDANDPSFNLLVADDYAPIDVSGEVSVVVDSVGTGRVNLVISDTNIGAIGGTVNDTIKAAILYKDTGTPATSPVIGIIFLSSPVTTTGLNINLDFASAAEGGNLRIILPSQA